VSPLALAVAALVAMEPAVALVHRTLMHGRTAWRWHRSHHRPPRAAFEANDLLPLVFAAATIVVMAIGSAVTALEGLLWIGAGVTAYGALYLVVHDLAIHRRLGRAPGAGLRYLRWVAAAHAVHHRTGGAPYGFLVPVVPAANRNGARDTSDPGDLLDRSPRRIHLDPTRRNDSRHHPGAVPDRPSAGSIP
jgi:beta-carotene 3-hydroxylase